MKWGNRTVRGHAGPGIAITKNRQSVIDKSDLISLNNGGHLSVGITKSRQKAYDERDKKTIENRSKQKVKVSKEELSKAAEFTRKCGQQQIAQLYMMRLHQQSAQQAIQQHQSFMQMNMNSVFGF
jgi:hypothetical protein